LRSGSTLCRDFLTKDKGWFLINGIDAKTIKYFLDCKKRKFKFYSTIKNPWMRLISTMDIISLRTTDCDVTDYLIFKKTLDLCVRRHYFYDVDRFGYANYTCDNIHMFWGTSVSCLFLETLGIEVTPLILETIYAYVDTRVEGIETFTDFLIGLQDPHLDAHLRDDHDGPDPSTFPLVNGSRPGANKVGGTGPQQDLRTKKAFAWIDACTQSVNRDGRVVVPSYSVYDWMNAEQKMYSTMLNLKNVGDRKQTALDTLREIISEVVEKVKLINVSSNDVAKIMTYPCDNLFSLLYVYYPYKNTLSDLYDFEDLKYLFDKNLNNVL